MLKTRVDHELVSLISCLGTVHCILKPLADAQSSKATYSVPKNENRGNEPAAFNGSLAHSPAHSHPTNMANLINAGEFAQHERQTQANESPRSADG